MRLKLARAGGGGSGAAAVVVTLPDAASVGDVVAAAATGLGLPGGAHVALFVGFPPREAAAAVVGGPAAPGLDAPAGDAGIKSGSVVTVEVRGAGNSAPSAAAAEPPAAPVTAPRAAAVAAAPQPAVADDAGGWACAACTYRHPPSAAGARSCEVCGTPRTAAPEPPRMARHVVPADNTCLFTALAYVSGRPGGGAAMRSALVDHMLAHPSEFDEGALGSPPAAYAAHMRQPHVWGGGLELSAASGLLGLQVGALDVKTGVLSLFGEDQAALRPRRVYLLYDGVHFDALHRLGGGGHGSAPQTVFEPGDAAAEAGAREVAAAARAARAFVDLAGFSLMCGVCGVGITGEKAAREHAAATGHANFAECADPVRRGGAKGAAAGGGSPGRR